MLVDREDTDVAGQHEGVQEDVGRNRSAPSPCPSPSPAGDRECADSG